MGPTRGRYYDEAAGEYGVRTTLRIAQADAGKRTGIRWRHIPPRKQIAPRKPGARR